MVTHKDDPKKENRHLEPKPKDPNDTNLNGLNGDGKILLEAYKVFSKGGITANEAEKLENIDHVLKDASLQLTKNNEAIIATKEGKTVKISPER